MFDVPYFLLLAILSSTFLLGSCDTAGSEATNKNGQTDTVYIRTTLNGEGGWSAEEVEANLYSHAGFEWISIFGDTTRGQRVGSLDMSVLFRGTGTYNLLKETYEEGFNTRSTGSSFYESDHDALLASYHPTDDTSSNQLTITSYDSTTGVLKGTFRTTLVVDSADRVSEPGEPPRRRPDTLHFTDGEFRVTVEDRR